MVLPSNAHRKSRGELAPDGMLTYVLNNPGRREVSLAAAGDCWP